MFLVLTVFSIYGFGAILLSYANLTQVAHEAVRTLSAVPGLETGEYANNGDELEGLRETCKQRLSSSGKCGHLLAQDRALSLIRFGNVLPSASLMHKVTIKSRYRATNGSDPTAERETVRVVVSVPVKNILEKAGIPLDLGEWSMSVSAEGPYMFSQTFRDIEEP